MKLFDNLFDKKKSKTEKITYTHTKPKADLASYIKYLQSNLAFMGILKNICGLESMNQMNENFNENNCIDRIDSS